MEDAAATDHSNFILTDGNKIDTAIRSRCAVFDFSYSAPADRTIITSCFRGRIIGVLEAEGLEPNGDMIDRLLERHGLDLRAVLNEIEKHT